MREHPAIRRLWLSGTLVALVDGLLRHAFALHPDGDRATLQEASRAARAYAGVVLQRPTGSSGPSGATGPPGAP